MWSASYTRGTIRILRGLIPAGLILACKDPADPGRELEIEGYVITAQANGADPDSGEGLTCFFHIQNFDIPDRPTNGSLIGTWTDTTTIRLTRIRTSPTQQVLHDTIMAGQEVTLTVPDNTHIQMTVVGPLTENLAADLDPNYPGWGQGDWTCGPEHPLARLQPGVVLTGNWQTQPIIHYPID